MTNRLNGKYDAVFSLGCNCLPAIQLEKNRLRTFAGVLDWMISASLTDVNRLIQNRFAGFMKHANLNIINFDYDQTNFLVEDSAYRIVSAHDFPVQENSFDHLASYPKFKEMVDRRVSRFLNNMASCRKLLFVRTVGTYEEVAELQQLLSAAVTHEFLILVINYSKVGRIKKADWKLDNVVAYEFPDRDIWQGQDDLWRFVLGGIRL